MICILLHLSTLLPILLEVLTTRHVGEHTVVYLSIRVHVYGFFYIALLLYMFDMWSWGWTLGGMLCMWSSMVGELTCDIIRSLYWILRLYVLYLWLWVMYGNLPSLERGQISVKPMGHAWFFVEFIHLFWKIKSYFQMKSIGSKAVYFIYLNS